MTKLYDILHLPTGTKFSEQCVVQNNPNTSYVGYPFTSVTDCNKALYIIEHMCNIFPKARTSRSRFLPYFLSDAFGIARDDEEESQYIDLLYGWWCMAESMFDTSLSDFQDFMDVFSSRYDKNEYEIIITETSLPVKYNEYPFAQFDDAAVGFINI